MALGQNSGGGVLAARHWSFFQRSFSLFVFCLGESRASGTEADEWAFSKTSYVWFSGLDGTLGVKGRKARVNLSFSDVMSNMDASGMLTFQGHKGKQYFFFDGMYLDMSSTERVSPSLFVDVGATTTRLQAAWGTRVGEWGDSSLHLFAGARYWNLKNELTFRTPYASIGHFSDGASRVDPIVGVRYATKLGRNTTFLLMLDAGGFGFGSNFTRGGPANMSFVLSEKSSIEVGYRYLHVDYEKDGFSMDASNDRFFLGFTRRLK